MLVVTEAARFWLSAGSIDATSDPPGCTVFAEGHFTFNRLATNRSFEPVRQRRALPGPGGAHPDARALARSTDRDLNAPSDVTAVDAAALRDQQQRVPSRSTAVLDIALPASGNLGCRR